MSNRPAIAPSLGQAVLSSESHIAELKAELANAIHRSERRQIEADLRAAEAAIYMLAGLRETAADFRGAHAELAALLAA